MGNLRLIGKIPDDTGDSESGVNGRCTPSEPDTDLSRVSSPSGKYFSLAGA